MHACLSVLRGVRRGSLLDQRKPKSSYKKAMHSAWAEGRREGERRAERGRQKPNEREKGKKLISFFSRAIHHRASQLQCHKLTE